jgi:glycosyltransferase involved in cell wall biosynthesis
MEAAQPRGRLGLPVSQRRILSLATVFPRPGEPAFGVFVERRLQALGKLAEVRVVAPVPLLEICGRQLRFLRHGPPRRIQRGSLLIHHPRWLYPPGLGFLHARLLAARLLPLMGNLAHEFPFDLLDAHFGYPEGTAAGIIAARLGKPFAVTLRGNEPALAASPSRREQMARAFRHAAAVVAVSGALRDFAVSLGAPPDRCRVIGNGVDSATFYPRPFRETRIRLGMAPDRIHLLSAGYLIPRKGHHRLAALLPALHEAGLPVDLWIVGGPGREGDSSAEIARVVRDHGLGSCVHLVPPVPPERLAEYMSACDLFCLASSREGWPNVVHEALACGAPVVAARVGAVEEIIGGEENGIVVPPDDGRALLDGLLRALRRRFDRDAVARRAAARSWDCVAQEVYDLFETILATPVAPGPS